MRKKSTRLLSAALAVCMMLSVLPVGAFAAEPGAAEPENGVSAQEELLMKPLRQRVLSGVMPRFAEGLSVERATLGNDAGMIGAARFFMQHS